jgi:hypothetical protein
MPTARYADASRFMRSTRSRTSWFELEDFGPSKEIERFREMGVGKEKEKNKW